MGSESDSVPLKERKSVHANFENEIIGKNEEVPEKGKCVYNCCERKVFEIGRRMQDRELNVANLVGTARSIKKIKEKLDPKPTTDLSEYVESRV